MKRLITLMFFLGASAPVLSINGDPTVTFLNVGQGNCTILKSEIPRQTRNHPRRYEICIFDIGTGQRPTLARPPIFDPNLGAVPQQDDRVNRKSFQTLRGEIRTILGDVQSIESVSIAISHPDSDHYNLLQYIAGPNLPPLQQNLPIRHLILGGNPIKYDQRFRDTADNLLGHGANIYFAATDRWFTATDLWPQNARAQQLNNAFLTDLNRTCDENDVGHDNIECAPLRYADEDVNHVHQYIRYLGDPNRVNLFGAAFVFQNAAIRVFCLAVNPTHENRVINNAVHTRRFYNPDDVNANEESLVFKIIYGQSSVLIPGDATANTTTAIELNYIDRIAADANFLVTTVALADHHGATTKGSNHRCFYKHVLPRFVITSNGNRYGHPSRDIIERFNRLIPDQTLQPHPPSLAEVVSHYFYYNTGPGNTSYIGTDRGIFSTMGGDVTVTLSQNGHVTLAQGGRVLNLP